MWALVFTAGLSRHTFVWLSFNQNLATVIDGCEAAWTFFGGMFKVLVPDNMATVVTKADGSTLQVLITRRTWPSSNTPSRRES